MHDSSVSGDTAGSLFLTYDTQTMHTKHKSPDTCYPGRTKPTLDTSSALCTHCSTVTALALQLFPEMQTDWTHLQW